MLGAVRATWLALFNALESLDAPFRNEAWSVCASWGRGQPAGVWTPKLVHGWCERVLRSEAEKRGVGEILRPWRIRVEWPEWLGVDPIRILAVGPYGRLHAIPTLAGLGQTKDLMPFCLWPREGCNR